MYQQCSRNFRVIWYEIVLIFALVFIKPSSAGADTPPQLTADSALLMDYYTGLVLYSYQAAQQRPPASTTKILTAVLGLELGSKHEIVSISRYAACTEGASLYLKQGQSFYLYDLIKGALINSGNDAAVAIAEHIGGKKEFFASLMNYKAKVIGAKQSQFCNPHGLPDPGHYSTAYDLALMARYALKNKHFQQIVKTRTGAIRELTTGTPIGLSNTNRLLWGTGHEIKIFGVKTGTTSAAGQCLVAAAEQNGRILISVVLHSDDRYSDTLRLLKYGFEKCRWFEVAKKGEPFLTLPVWNGMFPNVGIGPQEDLVFPINPEQLPLLEKRVHLEPFLKAPFPAGTRAGKMEVFLGDRRLAKTDLVTLTPVSQKKWFRRGL
ncbi:MAG: D-alanyl-D-alanine carboxypeptidase family protein [Bacillota bacterium]|nr:D-alanyl-D-alanine carboxypeptidase family protein [Bacillota bacterium]